jgi:lambda repressor-like predicted transcriptional regulator
MSSRIILYSANRRTAFKLGGMISGWFDRLKAQIKKAQEDGRSLRAISMSAGLNGHYLTHMFRKDTPPTVENFFSICEALGKDPVEILTGVKSDAETAKAVRMFAAMPEGQRKAFLAMLETVQPGSQQEPEKNAPAPAD